VTIDVIGSGYWPQPTLPGADDYSQETFEVERQKIFFARGHR
jgi:hypothetical protein